MPLASKTFADIITFTRSTTGTYTDSAGVLQSAAINVPRFDYNPSTFVAKGLLIEETRTNILVNSLLSGTSLATQNVTVTAAAYTLSFYGTGTIVLSGAHSATLAGTGAYPTRTTLTFTPSAGTLTLTVTGTVQYANLELGGFATSFIPTTTATVRSADVGNINTLTPWFNATEGTIFVEADCASFGVGTARTVSTISDGTAANSFQLLFRSGAAGPAAGTYVSTATQAFLTSATTDYTTNTFYKMAQAYKANDFAASFRGEAAVTDTSGSLPTVSTVALGRVGATYLNGHIRRLHYYPIRLTNTDLQALTV